jgi:hypothetical protein
MAAKVKLHAWRLTGIAAVLLATLVAGFAIYHHFHKPVQLTDHPTMISGQGLEISTASKNELVKYMLKNDTIISVSAVSVNLMQNELRIVFFQSKNDELNRLWEEYAKRTGTMSRAFSNVPDTNIQIANIINGDLNCILFKTAAVYERASTLTPWVCSMAVPPGLHGSGDFVGFLNFHLSREPTEKEKSELGTEIAAISSGIYKRDVQEDGAKH